MLKIIPEILLNVMLTKTNLTNLRKAINMDYTLVSTSCAIVVQFMRP